MAATGDNPPALPPLAFNESRNNPTVLWPGSLLSRSASLPSYPGSGRPPPLYNERGAGGEEFYTIPLHESLSEKPVLDKQGGSRLISVLLVTSSLAFFVALVVCILLSTTYGPSMESPVPQLFFVMSVFLIISAALFAKGMGLWLRGRARRNAIRGLTDVKEVRVDGYIEIVETPEKPQNARITKQERWK